MASPQKENGYTAIANEILEALARHCPGFTEGQILMFLLRKTYGWQKKKDRISLSQISESILKSRRMVIYALQNLESKGMVVVERRAGCVNTVSFQKDYERWRCSSFAPQVEKNRIKAKATSAKLRLVQNSVKVVSSFALTKETSTKENKHPRPSDSEGFQEFWELYPRKAAKKAALKAWKKLSPSLEVRNRMHEAVGRASASEQWVKDGGRFIPYPATWLNGERWKDDDGTVEQEPRSISEEDKKRLKELGYES